MAELDAFFGVWTLDPEASHYNVPLRCPSSGVYTILPAEPDTLWFHARWRIADDPAQQVAFRAALGPESTPVPDQPGLHMRTQLVDGALISMVLNEAGDIVHHARRELDDEGLLVTQDIHGEDGPARSVARYRRTSTKQVLVYRRDLQMRKGKIAAQCAHASMAVFFRRKQGRVDELVVPLDGPMAEWVGARFTKICLSLEDEDALLAAHEAARAAGLPCALITDAGRTEFHGVPTRTALAIGPAAVPEVDAITGPSGLVPGKLA